MSDLVNINPKNRSGREGQVLGVNQVILQKWTALGVNQCPLDSIGCLVNT